MLEIKIVDNGPFSEMINKRVKAWTAAKTIGSYIYTPPVLNWWYYNEFGTATQREGMGPKTGLYEIPGSGAAIFTYKGEFHYRRAGVNPVQHPGTKAAHVVSLSQPLYQKAISQAVRTGFAYGSLDSPRKVQTSVRKGVEAAKSIIADNYNELLQNNDYHTEPYGSNTGKLKGQKAGEHYREHAEVKDIKE